MVVVIDLISNLTNTGNVLDGQVYSHSAYRLPEEYLLGRYRLEIIDIYQPPIFARDGQIIAALTLIKELPPPLRKLIGNMSNFKT
jgi:circadian clock protein KaiB